VSAAVGPVRATPGEHRTLGFGLAAMALTIWSAWFVVTRLSVTRVLGPYDITALRLGVGAAVLLPGFLRTAPALTPRAWREGAVLAACWGVPFVLLLSWGVQLTSAGYAASLTPSLMPVFAGLIAWAVLGESPGRLRATGFAVTAVGVLALRATARTGDHAAGALAGTAALLAASALWAVYTLRVRRSVLTPLQAAALVCLVSSAAYLPFYALCGVSRLGQVPWRELAFQAVYQGVLVSGVSIAAYSRAIMLVGASAAASVVSLVPVLAAILAVPILGERPGAPALIAIATISAGALLTASASRTAVPTHSTGNTHG
jgi:drug/metabolite transporter (DMT)-like permease